MVKILSALLAGGVLGARIQDSQWEAYKTKFEKSYGLTEEPSRYAAYLDNMVEIAKHNKRADSGLESFRMGETPNTDLTTEEVNRLRNGYGSKHQDADPLSVQLYPCTPMANQTGILETGVNWVSEGAVTVVKNQMFCGDCWAFSAAGCMEGSRKLQGDGVLQSLSAQQLTDCATKEHMGEFGVDGCNGGWPQNAFYYAYMDGMESYVQYPFSDVQETCNYIEHKVVSYYSGCVDPTTSGNETMLGFAVQNVGPISVAIDAGLNSFHNYAIGIYYAQACSSTELDHAVLATGFGTMPAVNTEIIATCTQEDFYCTTFREGIKFKYPCMTAPDPNVDFAQKDTPSIPGVDCNPPDEWAGEDFWMVKNSWGPLWGMHGYIMMSRNQDNNCGIATSPSYALVG